MDHKCEHEVTAPFLLTLPTGELFILSPAEFAATFTQTQILSSLPVEKSAMDSTDKETFVFRTRTMEIDGSGDSEPVSPITVREITPPPRRNSRIEASCASCSPAIETLTVAELLAREAACSPPSPERVPRGLGARRQSRADVLLQSMIYNDYGELLNAADARRDPEPDKLNATQLLRLVNKAHRHEYRERLCEVIVLQLEAAEDQPKLHLDEVPQMSKERLSLWGFRELAAQLSPRSISEGLRPLVYNGPPRVLEIGCGDGTWCFKVKEEQSDWIVEGVDDTDHWRCVRNDVKLKDFMVPAKFATSGRNVVDYFSKVHFTQDMPEFTVRNLNSLTSHPNPIPHNLYGMVRGRDIFTRVESYKTFLEEVRLILQPDGVVEFIEIDPRPRRKSNVREESLHQNEHKSGTEDSWTDKIADRFRDPFDAELTNITTHAWAARVDARLKANLRPTDGVPAVHLKSWLEGNGYWDVKQNIVALPVGGETQWGKLLKEFLQYQIAVEDAIPKLSDVLPEVELDDMENGEYYLNLHFVTGRKPKEPRSGDLLSDGTRQDMTALKSDRIASFNSKKDSQWQRYGFEETLPSVESALGRMKSFKGAPELIQMPSVPGRAEAAAYQILSMNSVGGRIT